MNTLTIFLFYFIINYVNSFNISNCKKMGVINTELDSFTYQVYFCLESKIKFININDTKAGINDKNLSNISFSKNISKENLTISHNFLYNTSIVNKTIKKQNLSLNTGIDNLSYNDSSLSYSVSSSISPSISSSPSPSPSISPSISASISPSISPTISPSISPPISPSLSPSPSPSPSLSLSPSISSSISSISPSISPSISQSPSISPSISQSPSISPSISSVSFLYYSSYKKTNLRSHIKYTSSTVNETQNINASLQVLDSLYINKNNTNMTTTKFLDTTIAYKEGVSIAITISCSIVLFFLMIFIYYVAYKRYKKNSCKNKICPELILENGNSKKESGEKISKSAKKYIVDESTDEISNVDSEILKEEAKTWYVNEFKKELDLLKETTDISNNGFT